MQGMNLVITQGVMYDSKVPEMSKGEQTDISPPSPEWVCNLPEKQHPALEMFLLTPEAVYPRKHKICPNPRLDLVNFI